MKEAKAPLQMAPFKASVRMSRMLTPYRTNSNASLAKLFTLIMPVRVLLHDGVGLCDLVLGALGQFPNEPSKQNCRDDHDGQRGQHEKGQCH